MRKFGLLFVLVMFGVGAWGCQRPMAEAPAAPDYDRPLPAGTLGLRQITDPSRLPDFEAVARQLRDPGFEEARKRSAEWFTLPSGERFYPVGPITHDQVRASVFAMGEMVRGTGPIAGRLREQFDAWESVGWDGSGEVLFTGYYSPIFEASRNRTGRFQHPLYRRPGDLVTEPGTGRVIGQQQPGGGTRPYPARRELERSGQLDGLELVYLPSAFDAYIIQVNGSARLRMRDGSTMDVGFAGTNGREYTSIGRLMVEDGALPADGVSLSSIRAFYERDPSRWQGYTLQNERFVFFQEYSGSDWPAGSMGFRVTPMRTLATDKAIFPRGAVVWVETMFPAAPGRGGGERPLRQLMMDQDTGGAIRAAGRGDIYVGIGDGAEALAGRQAATGRMVYLLLKPRYVREWLDRMGG